jgi:transcription elongation factor SPT6
VIRSFDYQTLRVNVSFDAREIEAAKIYDQDEVDFNFDLEGEQEARRKAQEAAKDKKIRMEPRIIDDEHFKNVTYEQSCQILSAPDVELGAHMFRPSTKGSEHLSLTMKFPGGAFANYDIVERKKKSEGDLGLGKELWIEDMEFDDLEDVRWNFLVPIKDRLKEAINHRKWVENHQTAVQLIKDDCADGVKWVPYRLSVNPQYGGTISFLFPKGGQIREDTIRVRPDQWVFRHQGYTKLDDVIKYWKEVGLKDDRPVGPQALNNQLSEREERERKEKQLQESKSANTWGRPVGQQAGYAQPAHPSNYRGSGY